MQLLTRFRYTRFRRPAGEQTESPLHVLHTSEHPTVSKGSNSAPTFQKFARATWESATGSIVPFSKKTGEKKEKKRERGRGKRRECDYGGGDR